MASASFHHAEQRIKPIPAAHLTIMPLAMRNGHRRRRDERARLLRRPEAEASADSIAR